MARTIGVVGAPSSAGAYAPGPELVPAAFRRHGLLDTLRRAGLDVTDHGDVETFRWRPDTTRPETMNLDAGVRIAAALADQVAAALSDEEAVLVLGGDCSVELGTLSGALRNNPSTGLIYVDLDVDLNAPGAGEGALGWMGVAHMLDIPGADPALSGLGPRQPMLTPSDILFFAADNITDSEADTIAALGLDVIRLGDVRSDPVSALDTAAHWSSRFTQLLIHLDVDVLNFIDFPIAENTRRQAGLTFDELSECLAALIGLSNFVGLTIAQANPHHAPDEGQSFGRLNAMLARNLAGPPAATGVGVGE